MLDHKMMVEAMDKHCKLMKTLYETENDRSRKLERLKEYSICQDAMAVIVQKMNKPKVWVMNDRELAEKDKKMTVNVAVSIMFLGAFNTYFYLATDFEKVRMDQVTHQINKQLLALEL